MSSKMLFACDFIIPVIKPLTISIKQFIISFKVPLISSSKLDLIPFTKVMEDFPSDLLH